MGDEHELCTSCLLELPHTHILHNDNNFIEKRFLGRLPLQHATALLIFSKKGKTQSILHQIKYKGNEKLAIDMGRLLGTHIAQSGLFDDVDILIPVPLHRRKERKRGYNQSLLLCKGVAQVFSRTIVSDNLVRMRHTESQTHKNRQQRLENMEGVFHVKRPEELEGKHILLIDDVITTGATTEACCKPLLSIKGLRISIASLAVSGDT